MLRFMFIAFLFFSCSATNKTGRNPLIGVWQYDKSEDSVIAYKKSTNIHSDASGIQFLENGKLKVRQNSGWCGTPPISYKTVSGNWAQITDSTYKLNYPYWGGTIEQDVMVLKISQSALLFKITKFKL